MKNIFPKVVFFIVFLTLPTISFAGPIIRTGETISVESTQSIKGDFYGLGSKVMLSGTAENDVYAAGGDVTINAPINDDLSVLGGVVQIHGDVGDDVRIVGGDITIAKPVKGDVVVLGSRLTILSTAHVEGDILFMGEDLVVDGEVDGTIHGKSNTARINSTVGGDVLLTIGSQFTIGSNANIQGLVSYESNNDVIRAQDAVVVGDIKKTSLRADSSSLRIEIIKGNILKLIVILFATLSLYMLMRRQSSTLALGVTPRFGFNGLVGLGMLLTIPFITGVLLVSVVGSLVGLILILSLVSVICYAIALSPLTIGLIVQKHIFKQNDISLRTIGLGFITLCIASLVPVLTSVLFAVFSIVIIGTIGVTFYESVRDR